MKTRQNRPPRNTAWIKLGRIARAFSCLGLAACLHSCAPAAEEPPAPAKSAPGKTAPGFAIASLGGDTLKVPAQRDKVLLLNFWATWCGPCREEQPVLNDLYTRYRERGLDVWGIAVSSTRLAVELWVENLEVPYPILMPATADTSLLRQYGVDKGIPLSVLVARDGTIHLEQRGVVTAADSVAAVIEALLGPSI